MNLTDKQIRSYFKNIFGFRVRHVNLFRKALLHKSATEVSAIGGRENNERLEFLGDAVLGMIIADFLCHKYPSEPEGVLTQMRSKLVNRQRLSELALKLGLHDITTTSGHIASKTVPGNTFEAVVGAIFRDQGYKRTAHIILDNIYLIHVDIDAVFAENKDYKSSLLIWAQHHRHKVSFSHVAEPDKERDLFRAYVDLDDQRISEAVGSSVKSAEQRASEIALVALEQ